ncbi:uncharacterized protein BJ171DRAFT_514776 [Polychytrium aggregatum]|uniref:uncharacterized protein n=1 Tax=Polychytrium aggregatum TaxID=110093 RepID=UPI0022FE8D20|nr:uncharacterized protein BJ171DRAFT_514776 [Polychytrium aggregatum]KAI9202361.1 hypothetical protein BJ171DRAFT_514776 [Polychytrium aggregatum]
MSEPWVAGKIYTPGQIVTYQGTQFTATVLHHSKLGEEPVRNTKSWEPSGFDNSSLQATSIAIHSTSPVAESLLVLKNLGRSASGGSPTTSRIEWVACTFDSVPQNAINGGHDRYGKVYYIGRAILPSSIHVGKVLEGTFGGVEVPWSNRENDPNGVSIFDQFEILTGSARGLHWADSKGKLVGVELGLYVRGGTSPEGKPTFVGRASVDGELIVGECGEHILEGLRVVHQGRVVHVYNYQVLEYKTVV